jgi:predicted PurR-regulated permease PerM
MKRKRPQACPAGFFTFIHFAWTLWYDALMENSPNQVTVRVGSGTIVRAILFVVLFLLLFIIRDVILIILTAVVIASAVEPAARWLGKRGVPWVPAVICVYLLIAAVLASLFYFVIPVFIEQAYSFLPRLPRYIQSIDIGSSIERLGFIESDSVAEDISARLSSGELLGSLQGYIGELSGGVLRFASNFFGSLLNFVLIVILSFYLAVQQNGIARFLKVITPFKKQKYVIDLWRRSQQKIGRWMQGQLLLALIIGILVYAALLVLGIPNAFLFAVLAAVFELIPFFGPILAAIPAVIVAFVDGGGTIGLITVLVYTVIQQLENHLIYPLVVNKVVGVPPIVVILSILVGGKLAGFLGILLSVPIASAFMEYVDDIQKRHKLEEDRAEGV